jgi:hypothetical protein
MKKKYLLSVCSRTFPATRSISGPGWRSAIMRLIVLPALLAGLTGLAAENPTAPAAHAKAARAEGAITGGLRWLAEHQIRKGAEAGSWDVPTKNYRPAIASLAGLAFLANGHLPGDDGPYGTNVANALKYVTGAMAADGYVGQGDRSGMYIHAISTLFALSCLGMQADETFDPQIEPKLAEWCRRSLDVILSAQQVTKAAVAQGGWRYDPYTTDSDISVTCWQLLVLHAARQAGFEVEPPVFNSALAYLNSAFSPVKSEAEQDKGNPAGGYFYPDRRSSGMPHPSTTALAVLAMSLFDAADEQRTRDSLEYLRRCSPTWGGVQYGGFFFFSAFEWSQGMFQIGGKDWESFGPSMAAVLLDHQAGDGSWPYPPDNSSPALLRETGPAYPVAMAVLTLSIDKQFLPMFQRQRRLYEAAVAAAPPAEKAAAVAATETKPDGVKPDAGKSSIPMPEIVHEESPVPPDKGGGGAFQKEEPWEDPDEGQIKRPIGSRLDGP